MRPTHFLHFTLIASDTPLVTGNGADDAAAPARPATCGQGLAAGQCGQIPPGGAHAMNCLGVAHVSVLKLRADSPHCSTTLPTPTMSSDEQRHSRFDGLRHVSLLSGHPILVVPHLVSHHTRLL